MRYVNPVLPGFHPDPSVCRVGEDFYLVCSSFEYFPGIPVYHSRDLVNWRQIGNCLERAEAVPLMEAGDSGGVWAPTIRWHDGRFYVVAAAEGQGNFIVTAENAAGPWSDPIWLTEVGGIDPSLYFEDGRVYCCTNDRLAPEQEMISMQEIDPLTGQIIGPRHALWGGMGAHFLEAPHIYRIGPWYYLLTAEGGTFYTHMATISRSRSLFGPYEGCPDNPILTNACDPSWQVQCTGHGDLVEDAQGHWWMLHLGTRLARRTMTHLGRETFLTPVRWVDDWPVCGHDRRAVMAEEGPLPGPQLPPVPFTADMARSDWEPEWLFLRCPDMSRHRRAPGSMTLLPSTRTLRDPNPTFAGLRPPGFGFAMEVRFAFNASHPEDEAGLAIRLDSRFHVTCTAGFGSMLTLTLQAEDIRHTIARVSLPAGPVRLRLSASRERFVFDCAGEDGVWRSVGQVSTRFVATELAGRCFTGIAAGLYAACAAPTPARMQVHSFTMTPLPDA